MTKILVYSDLHLEFGHDFRIPSNIDADILILAGDIITFDNFEPLTKFLGDWEKPVLFVAGNHEYYTNKQMLDGDVNFQEYVAKHHKNIIFLDNSSCSIRDIEFFGGTMWTDFNKSNPISMLRAHQVMNDYKMIYNVGRLRPEHTVEKHEYFKFWLEEWLKKNEGKKRVVISHHAPVENPNSKYRGSELAPAFVATDMLEIIEKYQPDCWVHGHTHQCDNQKIGKTQIMSNQRGYPNDICKDFNEKFILELTNRVLENLWVKYFL